MLYIVPTPVGNLEDMTARGARVLSEVDFIACEDTRTSLKLLRSMGISKQLVAYHSFNERGRAESILERLSRGESCALISDAGTPGISDPGYELIRRCIEAGIEITALPGPTAFVPALVLSGLPPYPFLFHGFLPDGRGDRERAIQSVAGLPWTLIFYVSPHKAGKHILHLAEILGDRRAALVREISKVYEEARRGTLSALAESVSGGVRGELVLVVEGASGDRGDTEGDWMERARELAESGLSSREVVKTLSREYSVSKNEVKSFLYRECGKEGQE
ncbi:MAG: 16S rRNA (cytidine(1402)-2'-O)-methyltransferase [Synergistota bacterium]|nr:16S rRNA (cytidine(1402)-2'-O)-methyltransferase [Synergistota bacterium]